VGRGWGLDRCSWRALRYQRPGNDEGGRQMRKILGAVAVLGLIATACFGGSSSTVSEVNTASGAAHTPVTLNVWSFYTGREFHQYDSVLADFQKLYPWIKINHTPGKSDQDYIRAISSGTAPDIAISAGPDNVAKFCNTGAWQDLTPFLQQDNMNISSIIPPPALRYTSYNGDQCALPVLSDAYGLYYNTSMFKANHISSPPKTLSELEADAKALTVFNPDGSIKVAGFVPLSTFYESYALYYGAYTGGQWYSSDGKAAFASDSSWANLLEWEKSFITNVYGADGYNKLRAFVASLGGANSEWDSSQGFEVGRIAMTLDGEWRVAFIQSDHSNVPYATAPFPVADSAPDLYGAGIIGGDVIGIPKGAQNPAEAWLLVKYLATNTQAEEKLAEQLKNVPTTYESLKDPNLTGDPKFKTFLNIFSNPHSEFKPLTTIGDADETFWSDFVSNWEAGKVSNLQSGLETVSNNIDKQSQLG
jgi:multiple sugar transport system substrate-binding protein